MIYFILHTIHGLYYILHILHTYYKLHSTYHIPHTTYFIRHTSYVIRHRLCLTAYHLPKLHLSSRHNTCPHHQKVGVCVYMRDSVCLCLRERGGGRDSARAIQWRRKRGSPCLLPSFPPSLPLSSPSLSLSPTPLLFPPFPHSFLLFLFPLLSLSLNNMVWV